MRCALALPLLVVAGLACEEIAPPSGSPAPRNACPEFACAPAGGDAGTTGVTPSCSAGACVVVEGVSPTWVAVVSTPTDAFYAPGATWALSYSELVASGLSANAPQAARAACLAETCKQLPAVAVTAGFVDCQPAAATLASWFVGPSDVALPVRATFTPLWPAPTTNALVYATTLGLPLPPVVADTIPNPGLSVEVLPGPGGGPSFIFAIPDPPGAGRVSGLPPVRPAMGAASSYERALSPFSPFAQAFPPDVTVINSSVQPQSELVVLAGFDPTVQNVITQTHLPTFQLSRADGGVLDGWSATLRDMVTLGSLSNAPALHGPNPTVQLITSHHTPDALTGAQLVVVPPPAADLPTWIFTPLNLELGPPVAYPALPPPTTAEGDVVTAQADAGALAGAPVVADLVFEAVDLCRVEQGQSQPVHDHLSSTAAQFAYTKRVSTDAQGHFQVSLPLGNYRVTVVPRGAEWAVQTVSPYVLSDKSCNPVQAPALQVAATLRVRGVATVYDGRALAAATVEAIPSGCARAAALDGLPDADPACLPRFAQTVTGVDGAYVLTLDPGAYDLRVRPAAGSRFPWVVQPLSVSPTTTTAPATKIPPPVAAGLTLYDPDGNALFDTLVRVYDLPPSGPPYVEIGDAITDAAGHYDMYLAPSSE